MSAGSAVPSTQGVDASELAQKMSLLDANVSNQHKHFFGQIKY